MAYQIISLGPPSARGPIVGNGIANFKWENFSPPIAIDRGLRRRDEPTLIERVDLYSNPQALSYCGIAFTGPTPALATATRTSGAIGLYHYRAGLSIVGLGPFGSLGGLSIVTVSSSELRSFLIAYDALGADKDQLVLVLADFDLVASPVSLASTIPSPSAPPTWPSYLYPQQKGFGTQPIVNKVRYPSSKGRPQERERSSVIIHKESWPVLLHTGTDLVNMYEFYQNTLQQGAVIARGIHPQSKASVGIRLMRITPAKKVSHVHWMVGLEVELFPGY